MHLRVPLSQKQSSQEVALWHHHPAFAITPPSRAGAHAESYGGLRPSPPLPRTPSPVACTTMSWNAYEGGAGTPPIQAPLMHGGTLLAYTRCLHRLQSTSLHTKTAHPAMDTNAATPGLEPKASRRPRYLSPFPPLAQPRLRQPGTPAHAHHYHARSTPV